MKWIGKINPNKPSVLVIATYDNLAINAIRCVRMAGMTAHLMGADNLVGARLSRYCTSWVKVDSVMFDAPFTEAIAQIDRYCEEKSIGIVLGVDIPAILMLSTIQAKLVWAKAFPMANPDQVRRMNNKWLFARLLRENQLPFPETLLIESMNQLEQIPLAYPLVVKPLQMENGIGVRKLNSPAEARAHLRENHPAHQLPLLFQEFIPGEDIDLSILADRGKVVEWTIQKWLSNGVLEFMDDEQILGTGRKIVAAAEYNGVAHFDMRRDKRDGSVKILECNPRFWATLRESMWNGINFIESGVKLMEGKSLKEQKVNRHITYTFPSKALATFLRGDFSVLRRLSPETWRDAWQTFSDPFTFACQVKKKIKLP